jgi:hypothetical protein
MGKTFRKLKRKQKENKIRQQTARRVRQSALIKKREEKLAERALAEGTPSAANEAFAKGLREYQQFRNQEITDTDVRVISQLIRRAQHAYEDLPKNNYYVISKNRFVPLSKIPELSNFEFLYKDQNPGKSYYHVFNQDEDEDNWTGRVDYFFRVDQYPPYFFAITSNYPELDKLTYEQKSSLFWTYRSRSYNYDMITHDPVEFLSYYDSKFREMYEKSVKAKETAPPKLEALREKTLEHLIQQSEETTGRYIGENVEARLRSFLSSRPFARNYAGVKHNFQTINTSLFE